jgi:hypothetical protein
MSRESGVLSWIAVFQRTRRAELEDSSRFQLRGLDFGF